MLGSAVTVCVGGGGWVLKVNLVIKFGYSLALARPNNNHISVMLDHSGVTKI
jgi:hypothetical protein